MVSVLHILQHRVHSSCFHWCNSRMLVHLWAPCPSWFSRDDLKPKGPSPPSTSPATHNRQPRSPDPRGKGGESRIGQGHHSCNDRHTWSAGCPGGGHRRGCCMWLADWLFWCLYNTMRTCGFNIYPFILDVKHTSSAWVGCQGLGQCYSKTFKINISK